MLKGFVWLYTAVLRSSIGVYFGSEGHMDFGLCFFGIRVQGLGLVDLCGRCSVHSFCYPC